MSTFAAMILARYDCNGTAIASIDDLTLILQEMEKALTGSGLPDHDSQVHAEFSNVEGVYLFISKGIHELIMTQKNKNHVPSKE